MEQEKKTTSGAPSSDTTSALFVSARKKQLEQQEMERRAKEKEEERLAAEAEVRRLEAEVEERRRKAEEEARRIAEESRAKMAQAAENPNAVLGAPPQKKESTLPQMSKPALKRDGGAKESNASQTAAPAKAKGGKKTFILGALAGVALLFVAFIILVLVDISNDPEPSPPSFEINGSYYLNGDISEVAFYFDSNGSLYADSPDGSRHGEWHVEGGQLYLTIDDETTTARILDNDTLDFGEEGTLRRVLSGSDPGDSMWNLDENAPFDAAIGITSMMLSFEYPTSQFYIEDQTDDGFTLTAQDNQAYINYNKMAAMGSGTKEEYLAVYDALFTAVTAPLTDVTVIEKTFDEESSMGYFSVGHRQDGEAMAMLVVVQGWKNIEDGSQWYYAGLVDCPQSQVGAYFALFGRIHDSQFDT